MTCCNRKLRLSKRPPNNNRNYKELSSRPNPLRPVSNVRHVVPHQQNHLPAHRHHLHLPQQHHHPHPPPVKRNRSREEEEEDESSDSSTQSPSSAEYQPIESPLEAPAGQQLEDIGEHANQLQDDRDMCCECMQPIIDTQQMRQWEYEPCQRTDHRSCTIGHLAANNIKYYCNLCCMCAAKPCKGADKEVSGKNQFDWYFNCRRAFHSGLCARLHHLPTVQPRGVDWMRKDEAEHLQQGPKHNPLTIVVVYSVHSGPYTPVNTCSVICLLMSLSACFATLKQLQLWPSPCNS